MYSTVSPSTVKFRWNVRREIALHVTGQAVYPISVHILSRYALQRSFHGVKMAFKEGITVDSQRLAHIRSLAHTQWSHPFTFKNMLSANTILLFWTGIAPNPTDWNAQIEGFCQLTGSRRVFWPSAHSKRCRNRLAWHQQQLSRVISSYGVQCAVGSTRPKYP